MAPPPATTVSSDVASIREYQQSALGDRGCVWWQVRGYTSEEITCQTPGCTIDEPCAALGKIQPTVPS